MEQRNILWKHAMKFGLIVGGAMILYSHLLYLTNLSDNTLFGVISYGLFILGLLIGTKRLRDGQFAGYITYSRAFITGLLISLFVGFLLGIYTYVLNIIDPSILEKSLEVQAEAMLNRGMDEDLVEQQMTLVRSFTSPMLLAFSGILAYGLVGALVSLLTAAILRKDPPPFPVNNPE